MCLFAVFNLISDDLPSINASFNSDLVCSRSVDVLVCCCTSVLYRAHHISFCSFSA